MLVLAMQFSKNDRSNTPDTQPCHHAPTRKAAPPKPGWGMPGHSLETEERTDNPQHSNHQETNNIYNQQNQHAD
jgi:hypothetical protein